MNPTASTVRPSDPSSEKMSAIGALQEALLLTMTAGRVFLVSPATESENRTLHTSPRVIGHVYELLASGKPMSKVDDLLTRSPMAPARPIFPDVRLQRAAGQQIAAPAASHARTRT